MNWNRVSIVTKPTKAPLTLSQVKDQVAEDFADDDQVYTRLMASAVARIDGPHGIGYAMMSQTWRLTLDCFPSGNKIQLPGWPVKSITAVKYRDADDAEQTMPPEDYRLINTVEPAYVQLLASNWPTTHHYNDATVWVDYVLGEDEPEDVEPELRTAIGMLIANWYENYTGTVGGRAGYQMYEIPFGVQHMLDRHKRYTV